MIFALLCGTALGLLVESVRLQTGVTQIANRMLAAHVPVNLGCPGFPHCKSLGSESGTTQRISSIQVSNVTIGNMTLGIDFGNSTKTVSGIALETMVADLTNTTFILKAIVETTHSGSTTEVFDSISAEVLPSDMSVKIFLPDRQLKIGNMSGKCDSSVEVGKITGLSSETIAANPNVEKKVQNALKAHINNVVCHGGAPNPKNVSQNLGLHWLNLPKTGVDGFLDITMDKLIKTKLNPNLGLPNNPTGRAAYLTNLTNSLIIPTFSGKNGPKIANKNFGVFSLEDIKIAKVKVGELQVYQTILDPMMPETKSTGTYAKGVFKGITASVTFKLSTLFGEAPAFLNLKPSSGEVGITFSRDKNNFVVKPQSDCKVSLDFDLDVPSQSWNLLWQLFLGGFDSTLNNAISGAICGAVKTAAEGVLAKKFDAPAAGVWNNIVAHKGDQVYAINDTVFPWGPNWADKFYNASTGRHWLPATPAPKTNDGGLAYRLKGLFA